MIPLKAVFVISVLISGLIFSPSYSFAQSDQDDSSFASFFEAFMKIFSFEDEQSESVIEFQDAVVVQSSSTPIASAGDNQTVMQFEKVTLDGSSSTDPDGDSISFHWNQTEGPPVNLSDYTATSPMFNATLHGVLKFVLTVVDTSNLTDTTSVIISVIEAEDDTDNDDNLPPIASAGDNQTVMQFEKVTLDGSSSTDPDGDSISFHWNQTEGPPVNLSDYTATSPMFNATLHGVLKFVLTVVDTSNETGVADVYITVQEKTPEPIPDDDKDQNKVTICHIPPGNPENAHTITVGESAVLTHVAKHGDTIGSCSGDVLDDDSSIEKSINENKKEKDFDDDSGKGNNDDKEKGNSGKGNSGIDNSGKGNNDDKEKGNSGKGNSGIDNSGKGNNDDKEKGNSGKGNSGIDNSGKGKKDKDVEKSNSKLNDDDTKDEDDEDRDNEDKDDEDKDDEDKDDEDKDDEDEDD